MTGASTVGNPAARNIAARGAAVAVVSGDRVVYAQGLGVANIETGAPVTPDILFQIFGEKEDPRMIPIAAIVDGQLKEARKDCTVTMLDYMGSPVVTYSIVNAWPKKYTGVGLKADSNEVAVEGITLCHEGFERV